MLTWANGPDLTQMLLKGQNGQRELRQAHSNGTQDIRHRPPLHLPHGAQTLSVTGRLTALRLKPVEQGKGEILDINHRMLEVLTGPLRRRRPYGVVILQVRIGNLVGQGVTMGRRRKWENGADQGRTLLISLKQWTEGTLNTKITMLNDHDIIQ